MSLLDVRVWVVALALLALIALRGKRWAFLAFVVLGLLYFPAHAHWRVHPPKCEQLIPTMQVMVLSLRNYAHIALFAGFCWMSWVQFRRAGWGAPPVWAFLATLLAGALVELAEGMTAPRGVHCRLRDLVPAAAGALGAALVLAFWSRLFRKPGYVRIVKSGKAVAPRKPVAPPPPPPSPAAPPLPRGVVQLPPAPPRGFPAPPPDFSPTAPAPPVDGAPTEEVAPRPSGVARPEIVQRLQAMLHRLLAMLQQLWAGIRRRRRMVAVAVVLLALGGAATWVMLLEAPAPTVTEQPTAAAPPPPPRPLQAEAEGYYEPGYQFTVADRRFTRLTLRPEPFLTFVRPGTREEAGCAEARIGRDAVFLRCELYRVGMVTIDGRFPARFVTGRLDAPVLSALVTVTNPRGEVLYRARDSFRWHEPDSARSEPRF